MAGARRSVAEAHVDTGLRRTTVDHGVVVVRNVSFDPGEFSEMVATLGPLMFTPGERSLEGHPMVFEVTNRGRSTPPRSVAHTDTSYVDRPPSITALLAVMVPEFGGETVFHDQVCAATELDDSLRRDLAGVEFLHVASRVPDPHRTGDGVWHPVVRQHPERSVTTLFVTARERLIAARRDGVELAPIEAEQLIDRTHRAALAVPEVRHRWRTGDLVLMDNRTMLHWADHRGVVGERTLWRVMVRGEQPMAATPQQTEDVTCA